MHCRQSIQKNKMNIKTQYSLSLFLIILLPYVTARPYYRDSIPNGYHVPNWPGVGHFNFGGGGSLNPFGTHFQENGHQWTKTLCELDSDGDGKTNGFELGDPDCIWKSGDQPQRTFNITHPGFADDRIGPSDPDRSCANKKQDDSEFEISFQFPNYSIPNSRTTYACRKFAFPDQEDYHIVKFIAKIDNSRLLHHQILYLCHSEPASVEQDNYNCDKFGGSCITMAWGWAPGVTSFCLPQEVGFLVGKKNRYALLEQHYNNPELLEGEHDSSGVQIVLTPNLRNYSAGVLAVSVDQGSILIPPQSSTYSVTGTCPSMCTSRWNRSITAFSSILHAHKRGRKIWTELYRNGHYLRDFARNDQYNYNSQVIDQDFSPIKLLPGDTLKTTCTYNSIGVNNTVSGGPGTDDEMCMNFIFYYPILEGDWYTCGIVNTTHFRDGRKTAWCNGLMDMDSQSLLPNCDWEVDWGRYRDQALNVILPQCEMESSGCSPGCRNLMYQWIKNNTCVESFGFQFLLSVGCEGVEQKCNLFEEVFRSCDGLCAIGLDHVYCAGKNGLADGKCVEFECVYSNASGLKLGIISVTVGLSLLAVGLILGALISVFNWISRRRSKAQPEFVL
eukprot:TRINITY_DN3399_c0_g1_i1.p1 TRINITY_DN3399_c0_g1~~TRINITY_DN3399_c0_g1_i1.p1  ORF type:complete len:615 (-),score=52.27 TRINITY_DN3399_c0_g1_i1:93-1937(-)